jgi:hypothetical protein
VYLLLIILAAAGIATLLVKQQQQGHYREGTSRIYKERESLLTPPELEFFNLLKKVVGKNETIFAKVRQADILETNYHQNHPAFWTWFNRISRRHVDFVLCDPETTRVHTVIEINDGLRQRANRMSRNHELRQTLGQTNIKLVEIMARAEYDEDEIRQLIYGTTHAFDEFPLIADTSPKISSESSARPVSAAAKSPERSPDDNRPKIQPEPPSIPKPEKVPSTA